MHYVTMYQLIDALMPGDNKYYNHRQVHRGRMTPFKFKSTPKARGHGGHAKEKKRGKEGREITGGGSIGVSSPVAGQWLPT